MHIVSSIRIYIAREGENDRERERDRERFWKQQQDGMHLAEDKDTSSRCVYAWKRFAKDEPEVTAVPWFGGFICCADRSCLCCRSIKDA